MTDLAHRFGEWSAQLLVPDALLMPAGELGPPGALAGEVETPSNALLLRGPGRTVLVDAGSGILGSWYTGHGDGIDAALARAGCDAGAVDLVIATHLDFDHVGGLLAGNWPDDLRPAFPSVPVVVLAPTVASARRRDPDAPWNSATRTVCTLESHGLLRPVADGAEPAPGIRLLAAPGHRSGHACVEVGGGLLHLADTIHHAVHVEHPEWDGKHDSDPGVALETRRAFIERAGGGSGTTVVASHVFGFGRIEGGRWTALDAGVGSGEP
jgi:glyoxylase-like metal-dependent hydrolase (beta-lactamase superfamily II)